MLQISGEIFINNMQYGTRIALYGHPFQNIIITPFIHGQYAEIVRYDC